MERDANRDPVEEQDAVVYVHDPKKGVQVPADPDQIFAVVRVKGRQIKVIMNDRIQVEKLPFEIGDQICINDVLMIGTVDYTAIGRPTVQNSRVYATVEEFAQCEKALIFKKRRRKGYQKTQGHR